MSFTENWFGVESQDRLAQLARDVSTLDGLVIEIGSWEGRSTCVLANVVRPRTVIAVDTWAGSPGEISADLAAERDVFARFTENIDHFTSGNVYPVRAGWREFIPTVTDPIALCFIDAEHSYQEVYDNIRAVLPKMAPGGVICGDDAGHPPVRRAVLDVLPPDDVLVLGNVWSYKVPDISPLHAQYLELSRTPSDIFLHLPRFVGMVQAMGAKTVIELGTRTGVSTVAWLYALETTGGHLWSVDLDGKPPIGDHPHWTFIQGDDESDTVLAQLPPQADIVFLDTSHWYKNTCRELELYLSQVRPGGLIVCHDTELPMPEGADPADGAYPVKRAIQEFTARHGLRWFNVPECWGLGVIEVI